MRRTVLKIDLDLEEIRRGGVVISSVDISLPFDTTADEKEKLQPVIAELGTLLIKITKRGLDEESEKPKCEGCHAQPLCEMINRRACNYGKHSTSQ